MLFADKADNRYFGMPFKMTKDENDWIVQESRRLGISKVALLRKALREMHERAVEQQRNENVEIRTRG
jgi:hypothetical protein